MSVLTVDRMHTTRLRRLPIASEGPTRPHPEVFESIWQTDESGSSTDFQIQLPTLSGGTYDFHVDWGDGNSDDITVWNDAATLHTYVSIGTYTVQITGTFVGFAFNNATNTNGIDPAKLLKVKQWGVLELGNDPGHFYGCTNLAINANDSPVVGTTLENTFRTCSVLTGGVGNWDVSSVTNMTDLFRTCILFDDNLNSWVTTSVTTMVGVFRDCIVFNGNISSWDTAAVTTMNTMLFNCVKFNQDIGNWDVSLVEDMRQMLSNAAIFNQDIGTWEVGEVTDMSDLFSNAENFNQDISTWSTLKVLTMDNMFKSVTLDHAFNQDIGGWGVGAVTTMRQMFQGATQFNQDLSSWNTGSVTNMLGMFRDAVAFDQDIGSWDIIDVTTMTDMFLDATLSTTNYNLLLTGWEAQAVQNDVDFHGGNSTFDTGAPATAKADLIADHMWTIVDGGPA